jgi:FkbM family methyltransferase
MSTSGEQRSGPAEAAARGPRSRLRPAKIRTALRRRWFEQRLERLSLRPFPAVQLGGEQYGGWALPDGLIEPSWLCYSVGAGGDISFDMDLIRRYGIRVRVFDPVSSYVLRAVEDAGGDPRLTVHEVAIATTDGPLRMQVTHDRGSASVSTAGLYDSDSYIEVAGRTLPSLKAELGDPDIDLLKLDVEGGEYELLANLDLRSLGVKVFTLQLHHTGTVSDVRRLIEGLASQGYDPVARHPVVKIAFARRDLL